MLRDAVERVLDEGATQGCRAWAREIHAMACEAGDPDPIALAERLLLTELGRCYERAGAAAESVEYVRDLRATHRRKRNVIAVLDVAGLPG